MLGSADGSKLVGVVGLIAAAIGVVGYTVFGWRFGQADGPVPFALGLLAALLAIVWTVARRF